ncbi:TetR/AcrR family transcriptional regulator [Rhodococcus qingshengii]|uniref:TetR family transcriptional regulator n=3 Tax=Rhodococcus erythropolis group TaxID=2840174 RepID=A0A6G9D2M9_RHOER|nr:MULTISPECIES: WHG domain-containing protein [Rhodococcus]NHE68535.1 TetR/AcrR family transcriptional regulator [Rhodococcus sp. D-46]OCC16937.1 TetR family transcriptional regulator [Prescottella equi]ARE36723.1 TetR family transcriptional regulator [Rhodococcus sp. BH4]KZL29755.1 TetR family transcriptional regulator [Rhodococcus qingshengii]MBQ9052902.1 TetR/AcrR family transcriptional regulator [Rhodococcus sp. (in: high G+C Gram-positive bacteria)]
MSTSVKGGYHHGDLKASLLASAMRMLEAGEPFSMRAIAREVGVSATAPYRHFADREALESALAAQGLRDLKADLTDGRELPSTSADLAEFAVAYVEFALRRPALFRLMFGNECDTGNDERVQAAGEIHLLMQMGMTLVFPDADSEALASAAWALAHGLACLHLDGKMSTATAGEAADRVRAAFAAILAVQG